MTTTTHNSTASSIARYLCIGCPMGCRLEVEENQDKEIVEVRGFSCRRGEEYAKQEHIEPQRMVTTTVAIDNGLWARLPVRTTAAIAKEKTIELCQKLRSLRLCAPVNRGDIVLPNVFDTGVDVVASRSMPTAER